MLRGSRNASPTDSLDVRERRTAAVGGVETSATWLRLDGHAPGKSLPGVVPGRVLTVGGGFDASVQRGCVIASYPEDRDLRRDTCGTPRVGRVDHCRVPRPFGLPPGQPSTPTRAAGGVAGRTATGARRLPRLGRHPVLGRRTRPGAPLACLATSTARAASPEAIRLPDLRRLDEGRTTDVSGRTSETSGTRPESVVALAHASGLLPKRFVTLEVPGRRTGKTPSRSRSSSSTTRASVTWCRCWGRTRTGCATSGRQVAAPSCATEARARRARSSRPGAHGRRSCAATSRWLPDRAFISVDHRLHVRRSSTHRL